MLWERASSCGQVPAPARQSNMHESVDVACCSGTHESTDSCMLLWHAGAGTCPQEEACSAAPHAHDFKRGMQGCSLSAPHRPGL
jgi:hypothetical protein